MNQAMQIRFQLLGDFMDVDAVELSDDEQPLVADDSVPAVDAVSVFLAVGSDVMWLLVTVVTLATVTVAFILLHSLPGRMSSLSLCHRVCMTGRCLKLHS